MKKTLASISLATAGLLTLGMQAQAATLEDVQSAGELRCGVSTGLPGFSQPDSDGTWRGIDVDTCRAVAAAVLGNADAVEFVPLTAAERFTALQSGEIDMLSRNTTWTTVRDASLGLNFTGTNYYDGQGFLVKSELGVDSATQLDGASVCIQAGTTTELNLADYFRANGMEYEAIVFDTSEQSVSGFDNNRCDILTSDTSQLAALRTQLSDPSSAVVLPEIISKEPLGPVVRQGDDEWFNVVKWVLFLQINAEEYGVSMDNVDDMLSSDNPNVQRIVGTAGDMGDLLNLPADFGYQVISQVGNYGEMFERNVGPDTPIGLSRGVNALWTDGGILYAPPVR
ncbi:transporter substrate-binding domain-containing protein [Spiribacter sp. C176]|uniref:Transporter substrate-binding domain-containing protein n=1 Tax=Spiribacter salilacus TaxID=2664894 RepID=A0A6N7QP16_9GAMM|nr:amino acid ABC transporter substrate-binding protein [Spiribacter salilacus]MRH77133.1 transporter substrate-binding domain-containing protein [Spiribacter salilacus]